MNWHLDSSDSRTTYPHKVLYHKILVEGQLKIKMNNSTIRTLNFDNQTIDLMSEINDPWDSLKFDIRLSLDEEENVITDVCNNQDDAIVGIWINCMSSRYQRVHTKAYESPVTQIVFEINRKDFYEKLELEAFIVLNKDYEPDETEDYAYRKGSVLATANSFVILTDFSDDIFGGGIENTFSEFTDNKNALYRLKFKQNENGDPEPVVEWNARNKFVTRAVRTMGKEGTEKTRLRDAIIRNMLPLLAFELAVSINTLNEEDYPPESLEMKMAEYLRKILGYKNISEVFEALKSLNRMEHNEISEKLQHQWKSGSTLDNLIENAGKE